MATERVRRIDALNNRWQQLHQVIAERANDPAMANVPGGKTGLLVRTVKVIGTGVAAREVEEYSVDVALLKEMRELEKQASIEVGQWSERREVTGKNGGPIVAVVGEAASEERRHR